MWEHDNHTPFAVDHSWVRDKNGGEVWVVAVKATFDIKENGTTEIAKEQEPVQIKPLFRGEPASSSLLYDCDLYETKPTTDILLHGHAYAPQGKAVSNLDVSLKVANVHKTLLVTGNRLVKAGALSRITAAEPFTKMSLSYEHAYGGKDSSDADPSKHHWDTRNPVGVGYAVNASPPADIPLPNVEYSRHRITALNRTGVPASFGPVASHWQPRLKWGGTYGDKWMKERQPLWPEDFDTRFFLAAPPDQQAEQYLRGGETVELQNLTPGGLLSFPLPRFAFGFSTRFYTGETIEHRGELHTIIIEPDFPRLMMVWHTHLPCHVKMLKLKKTSIVMKNYLN